MNEYIVKKIPIPLRDFTTDPKLIVIRSFDVNKPGAEVHELKGGVAGGSLLTGVLRVGQEVEIRPGIVTKDSSGRNRCKPIFSRIVSLHAENNHLQFAVPGGLIGVGTKMDPTLCRADRLVGQVLGAVGKLPNVYAGESPYFFDIRVLIATRASRTGDQPVLTSPTSRCENGRQKTDQGLQVSQERVIVDQHRIDFDGWKGVERQG